MNTRKSITLNSRQRILKSPRHFLRLRLADLSASTENGSALIVFYSKSLGETQSKIKAAGGSIIKPIFSFPGGHRFHFGDPNANEYAVWSDVYA